MDYTNQNARFNSKPLMHNGMVKVLPSLPPPQFPFTAKRGNTQQAVPTMPPVYQQVKGPAFPVPKIPPPPKSPRPLSLKRAKSLAELRNPDRGVNEINNQQKRTPPNQAKLPIQQFTFTERQQQIKQSLVFPSANKNFTKPVQQFQPVSPSSIKTTANHEAVHNRDKGFGQDTKNLHDEIALLKRELELMNKPMREHDDWLRQQSEQVKELVEQQKKLQTNLSLTKPRDSSTNDKLKGRKSVPPPLPTSPKPKLFEKTENMPQITHPKTNFNVQTRSTSNPFSKSFEGNINKNGESRLKEAPNKTINEKANVTKSALFNSKSIIEQLDEGKRRNKLRETPSSLSSPEKVKNSNTNVRRISGFFEQVSASPTETKPVKVNAQNASERKRQNTAPGISEKLKQLSPEMQSRVTNKELDPVNSTYSSHSSTSKPVISTKPQLSPKPLAKENRTFEEHTPNRELPQLLNEGKTNIDHREGVEEVVGTKSPSNYNANNSSLNKPSHLPQSPTIKYMEEISDSSEAYMQLSNTNFDKLSISSRSSTSSLPKSPESFDFSDQNSNASKADLMEQIRQFGKIGNQKLKKTSSVTSDSSSTRTQHGPIHEALQSRFQAIHGIESDSGEGESYSDDNSDDWDD